MAVGGEGEVARMITGTVGRAGVPMTFAARARPGRFLTPARPGGG
jgi:hypothetical protein